MDAREREELLTEGQRRIELVMARAASEIAAIADEVENLTGERIGPPVGERAGIGDMPWAKLLVYRQECQSLLAAIALLEPLMGPGAGGRRASSVGAALKVAAPETAELIVAELEAAGLVSRQVIE